MPGGGTLTGAGAIAGATGETTLTEGTGFTVGAAKGAAAVRDAPHAEQKAASSLLLAPQVGHFFTIFNFPPLSFYNPILLFNSFLNLSTLNVSIKKIGTM